MHCCGRRGIIHPHGLHALRFPESHAATCAARVCERVSQEASSAASLRPSTSAWFFTREVVRDASARQLIHPRREVLRCSAPSSREGFGSGYATAGPRAEWANASRRTPRVPFASAPSVSVRRCPRELTARPAAPAASAQLRAALWDPTRRRLAGLYDAPYLPSLPLRVMTPGELIRGLRGHRFEFGPHPMSSSARLDRCAGRERLSGDDAHGSSCCAGAFVVRQRT